MCIWIIAVFLAFVLKSSRTYFQQMETLLNRYLAIHDDPISLTLDSEGRWRTFRLADRQFRRLVNGQIVELVNDRLSDLSQNATHRLHALITHHIKTLISKAKNRQLSTEACNIYDPELQVTYFQRAAEFSTGGFYQIWDQYLKAYPEPVTMLPPDRYRDLVLLPATGCPRSSSGNCTFCTLYPNAGFHVFSSTEFKAHIIRVRQLFGNAVAERTGVFLGSASALSLSQRRLVSALRVIREEFGSFKRGIAAFFDPYLSPKRTKSEYVELKNLGLRQVTIGLESGSGVLRQLWGKPADLTLLEKTIDILKESEIQVALTALTGFHTEVNYLNHVDETVNFAERLPLDHDDIFYLSPLDPSPFSEDVSVKQITTLKHRLRQVTHAKVVPYLVNKFRYYA